MGMIVIVTLHILLAVGFMLYFFHVPSGSGGGGHHNITEVTVKPINNNMNDTAGNGEQEEKNALETEKKVQAQIQTNETGVKDSGGDANTNEKEVTKREDEVKKQKDVSKDNSSEANKVQDSKDLIDSSKGDKQEIVSESENNLSGKENN